MSDDHDKRLTKMEGEVRDAVHGFVEDTGIPTSGFEVHVENVGRVGSKYLVSSIRIELPDWDSP